MLKETVLPQRTLGLTQLIFVVVVVVVDSLCAGMCCPTLRTPTRSKPSPAAARASPLHLWCTSWGPPTVATDAYRGEQRPRCATPVHVETQQNICDLSALSHLLLFFSSKGEECDDMNSMNGDGCSSQCKKEPFFNCIGKCCQRCNRCVCSPGRLSWIPRSRIFQTNKQKS